MSEENNQQLVSRFDPSTAVTRFTQTEKDLAELAERHTKVVFDVSTSKGMKEAKDARAELRKPRIAIEETRVEAKRDALEFGRAVDAHAKKLTLIVEPVEKKIDEQIKAEEKRQREEKEADERREQEKIARENALLDALRDAPTNCIGKSVGEIEAALERATAASLDELTGHAHERAVMLKAQAIEKLGALLAGAKSAAIEAERRAEDERRRQAEEKRQLEERQAAEKREREERQVREDAERRERQAKEDAERAEQRRKDEEERKRLETQRKAQQAEEDRLRKLRLEQEERDRKAARDAAEQKEIKRVQKLRDSAPALRLAAINMLTLATAKGFGDTDEAIQLKAAIEVDAHNNKPKPPAARNVRGKRS